MRNIPPNSKKEYRDRRIDIRLTPSEYADLLAAIDDSPYTSKGAYIRARIFSNKSPSQIKTRFAAFLAAGQLRDSVKKLTKDFNDFVQSIKAKKMTMEEKDKQLMKDIKILFAAIRDKLQNAEL